jgi:DtxR family Mn-dependent transcriptional regulator
MMTVTRSAKIYLEAILILEKRNGIARSVDVARELNYSKPSVSRAIAALREEGLIEIGCINQILLTDEGRKIAKKFHNRCNVIKAFLTSAGVEEKTAALDAQRLSHIISDEVFIRLKTLLENN